MESFQIQLQPLLQAARSTPPVVVLPATVVSILLTYWLTTVVISSWRLRHFKGPWLAKFSNAWLAWASYSGRATDYYWAARQKYRTPLMRVGPDTLITDDPNIVRQINGLKAGYGRAKWYEAFHLDPYFHNMFSTRDLAYHDDIKSKTAAAYSGREVPGLEAHINGQLGELKKLIRTKYISTDKETKPFDFAHTSNYFALDALSTFGFGKAFGFLEQDTDIGEFLKKGRETFPFIGVVSMVPALSSIFFSSIYLSLFGPKVTDTKGLGKIFALSRSVVDPRFDAGGKKEDDFQQKDMLLTILTSLQGSFMQHGLNKQQCQAEVLLMILAGSDSTSGVIRSTMLALSTTPQVYKKLQDEIDTGIRKGKISSPITVAEAKALPYLQAVIYESIRYHPPVIGLNTKVVPSQGDTLAGMYVPGGTNIAVNPWALMRHEPTFGKDVDVFRPERFMNASPEERASMQRVVDLMFGAGRFMCAGKTVAWMELNKIFVELLRDFDFQIINIRKPCEEVLYIQFLMKNFLLRVTERPKIVPDALLN
ncbi:cytochrome P450 [Rhypophila decipiens]|uniref:Cytochrome P450 n=1 Tax=Rhypophila decipiens TaxID=261697 RepID=A0AAN6Y9V9_9PEZI|nr:cytochrome P450 [Rhypophila decipiens]